MKYCDYARRDEKSEYARECEEVCQLRKEKFLLNLGIDNEAYRKYFAGVDEAATHNGDYLTETTTNRLRVSPVGARAVDSCDVHA